MPKFKPGDKVVVRPDIYERDKDQHYLRWNPQVFPNTVFTVLNHCLYDQVEITYPGSEPLNHFAEELILYRKPTVILT